MAGEYSNQWKNINNCCRDLDTANVHCYDSVEQKSKCYQFHVQISCYDMSSHLDTLEDTAKVQITAFFEFIVIVVSHLA